MLAPPSAALRDFSFSCDRCCCRRRCCCFLCYVYLQFSYTVYGFSCIASTCTFAFRLSLSLFRSFAQRVRLSVCSNNNNNIGCVLLPMHITKQFCTRTLPTPPRRNDYYDDDNVMMIFTRFLRTPQLRLSFIMRCTRLHVFLSTTFFFSNCSIPQIYKQQQKKTNALN